jgi:methionyl-tRNA synthetase
VPPELASSRLASTPAEAPASKPLDAKQPAQDPPTAPTLPAHITIDDFAKVELRVAQVIVAERIPKADKLLRLEVDLGYEKRQILAGIAQYYEPEKLIGRKIVIVANLAPRKMRGLESNGMLLAASLPPDGAPVLAGFLEDVPLGARLK